MTNVAATHSFCTDQTNCFTQTLIPGTSKGIKLSVEQSVIVIMMFVHLHVFVHESYSD